MHASSTAPPEHEVVIVGAGFSGIGVAISLAKAGIRDFRILESGDAFGGTWQWNTYPGVAVDIPSFSYQFSFDKHSVGAAHPNSDEARIDRASSLVC